VLSTIASMSSRVGATPSLLQHAAWAQQGGNTSSHRLRGSARTGKAWSAWLSPGGFVHGFVELNLALVHAREWHLVQFGGLVLSTIASMPPGRSRVATQVVIDSEAAREQVRNRCMCSLSAVLFMSAACLGVAAGAVWWGGAEHDRQHAAGAQQSGNASGH
jgi:hypothetical protein